MGQHPKGCCPIFIMRKMYRLPLGRYRKWPLVLLWLVSLLLLPWALGALAGGTDVTVVSSPGQVFAEVYGTRLEIPPETLRFSAESKALSAEYPSPLSQERSD